MWLCDKGVSRAYDYERDRSERVDSGDQRLDLIPNDVNMFLVVFAEFLDPCAKLMPDICVRMRLIFHDGLALTAGG